MADNKKHIKIESDSETKAKDWDEVSNRELDDDETIDFGEQGYDNDSDDDVSSESGAGALEHPSYEGLEDKLTNAEQLAQKNYDSWLRTKAEFDNFKRRSERDLSNAHKYAVERLVQDMIPVLDSLDQGLEIKDFQDVQNEVLHQVREGMELTYKMLLDTLAKYGIKQINPEGEKFNPEHHEAMSLVEDEAMAPNSVIKVFQKGYVLHDRLIRAARVVVSK